MYYIFCLNWWVRLFCRYCEDSLAESVATLIWVAPRLSADIQELTQVYHTLQGQGKHQSCMLGLYHMRFLRSTLFYLIKQVSLQLENKFGKPFVQQARSNMSGAVNPKV